MRRARSWLRLAVPLVLLALVLSAVDAGAAWERMREARLVPLLGALALAHTVIVASALRWSDTARRLGHTLPPRRALAEYYVSSLLNQVLPGGVAGDAMRVWRGRDRGGAAPVARGVVIERLAGQVAVALALVAGVALGGVPGTGRLVAVFVGGVVLLVGLLALWRGFGPDLRRAWGSPGAAIVQGMLNGLVSGALVGGFWLCARAVGTPMSPAEALVLIPVCLAAMLVPVGVGGLGLREGSAAALWPLAGHPAEAGVAAALLFGLATLVATLPGIAVLMRHRP